MTDTLSRIFGPVDIANGASTVFTGSGGHVYTIKHIVIVNNSGGAISVKLGIGGVADANLILPFVSIDAGGKAEFTGLLVLTGAEAFEADTSADGLTITASGLDQGP